MVNKFIYHFKEPQRGDIVVFDPPEELHSKWDYIKRVIALPGEKVEVKKGRVYINDQPLKEPYLNEAIDYEFGPVVVPDNALFVMGDNRNESYDSHRWNTWLTRDRLKGKAIFILLACRPYRIVGAWSGVWPIRQYLTHLTGATK